MLPLIEFYHAGSGLHRAQAVARLQQGPEAQRAFVHRAEFEQPALRPTGATFGDQA